MQPLLDQPLTDLRANFSWTNATHLGTDYAAILVKDGYQPQCELSSLPEAGGNILAVAVVPGTARPPSHVGDFSGYQWRLRDGTYEFVVRGLDSLEPAAAFDMFTYDYASGAQQNRENDRDWSQPTEFREAPYTTASSA